MVGNLDFSLKTIVLVTVVSDQLYVFLQLRQGPTDLLMVVPRNDAIFPKLHTNRY